VSRRNRPEFVLTAECALPHPVTARSKGEEIMIKRITCVFALLVAAAALFGCANLQGSGWTTLIDGDKGLDNFIVSGSKANWRPEGGAIVADQTSGKGTSVLVSKKSFKNFQLYAEFWAAENTNSGIYLRIRTPDNVSTATGAYEVQIWDKNPNPVYGTGSLVNVAAVNPIYKAGGRWNTFEIYANGPEMTVRLNGVVTVSAQDGRFPEGPVGIQFNEGPIKVRKLLVKEL
jgi:hypothetical protein